MSDDIRLHQNSYCTNDVSLIIQSTVDISDTGISKDPLISNNICVHISYCFVHFISFSIKLLMSQSNVWNQKKNTFLYASNSVYSIASVVTRDTKLF